MNEQAYIDKLKAIGNLGEDIGYTVSLLAKSYFTEGDDINTARNRLEEDIAKYEPELSKKQSKVFIENALKLSNNHELIKVNEILITQMEMNCIMNIESDNKAFKTSSLRRLAFTLLCFAKFEMAKNKGNDLWINYNLNRIYKAAKLTGRSESQNNMYLHELYNKGLVKFAPHKNGIGVRVNFVDEDENENSNIVVRIKDINYAGDYFLQYCGKKYIECKSCGKPILKTTVNLLYCKDCSVMINREKTRNRMAELRKNKVSK